MRKAAEKVANLTYQKELAQAQLMAAHMDYMKACMNLEMQENLGEGTETKKREVAWKADGPPEKAPPAGPPEKAPPGKRPEQMVLETGGWEPPYKAPLLR